MMPVSVKAHVRRATVVVENFICPSVYTREVDFLGVSHEEQTRQLSIGIELNGYHCDDTRRLDQNDARLAVDVRELHPMIGAASLRQADQQTRHVIRSMDGIERRRSLAAAV